MRSVPPIAALQPRRRRGILPAALALFLAAGCAAGPPAKPEAAPSVRDAGADRLELESLEARARDSSQGPEARAAAEADLGLAYARAGRWEEAAAAFQASLDRVPDRPRVLFNLGVADRHLGRHAEARDSYLKAAALAPQDMDIPYNLGILYEVYLNEPDRALAAYTRYVEGGGPEAERVRGWIDALERRRSDPGGTVR